MSKPKTGPRIASAWLAAAALLSACGGGGGGSGGTPAPVSVACGTANGTSVTHSANVSANETWAGGGVTHLVPNSIAINGTATVTVQPCALVALGAGASIAVNSSAKLVAAGTDTNNFVTFQRSDAAQAWGALSGTSPTSLIDLSYTVLNGGGAFGGQNPTIALLGPGYAVAPAPMLRVNNVSIQSSKGAGVYLDANGAFTADSQALTVTGAGGIAVWTTMMSLGSIPSGSYTGNGVDEINIFGPNANVFADLTIQERGVPVRIQTASMVVAAGPASTATVTLTVQPGVTVIFPRVSPSAPGALVQFGTNGNSPSNKVGVLNALGTLAKPITFTSGEAVPAPGDWKGLWLDTATGSQLDHVVISYAGGANGLSSANCRPQPTSDAAALIVGDFEAQYVPPSNLMTNSTIEFSEGFGIDAVWPAGTFNTPDLTATNTFPSNAGCAQTHNALTPPGTCGANLGCTVN